ncbi:MAG: glycoside hydrolase family 5 protein [Omnitrophica bacterium]|nr:glycoside hydrolase family 5 protein [Candidatus Omnitrophota bacterium]
MSRLEVNKTIKGVNLGSWLLMEGYILGGRNISESIFKGNFKKIYGKKELEKFEYLFRKNFITKDDFKRIAHMGANSVRVPFNYRLIEKRPYFYSEEGFNYLEKIFAWATEQNLGIILDLHAACGAQNCDWHSDSAGKSLLWNNKEYQQRTIALWEVIADRFKDKKALIGYDLLNEPVLGRRSAAVLKRFYRQLIKRIRLIDKKNLIFLEGDIWAQRIDFLEPLIAEGISISIHTYHPLEFTFNFSPFYKFPGKIGKNTWDKAAIHRSLEPYFKFSQKNKVKIFVGEFGINWRGGFWGELDWLRDMLKAYDNYGFGYTYWTYKAIANSVFPDGLYQHIPNSKYINREGPVRGWDTYLDFWGKEKKKIVDFWNTTNFSPNRKIINLLKEFFKK